MYYKIIFSLAIALFLSSCGGNAHKGELKLNNGDKWEVIESMIVYIRAMEKDVSVFENSPQKDYQTLAGDLQKNIDLLISNCTMKGAPHDELHKWLVPHIGLVESLSDTKDDKISAEIVNEIQASFITFNQYFQ